MNTSTIFSDALQEAIDDFGYGIAKFNGFKGTREDYLRQRSLMFEHEKWRTDPLGLTPYIKLEGLRAEIAGNLRQLAKLIDP